ncbi:MAG: hypothetical protein HY842_00050 [Bacteroidetes bacterium]|nr:hypothetical protein [Bacteroidota bacterium]
MDLATGAKTQRFSTKGDAADDDGRIKNGQKKNPPPNNQERGYPKNRLHLLFCGAEKAILHRRVNRMRDSDNQSATLTNATAKRNKFKVEYKQHHRKQKTPTVNKPGELRKKWMRSLDHNGL